MTKIIAADPIALYTVTEAGAKDQAGNDTGTSWTFGNVDQAVKHSPMFAADLAKPENSAVKAAIDQAIDQEKRRPKGAV